MHVIFGTWILSDLSQCSFQKPISLSLGEGGFFPVSVSSPSSLPFLTSTLCPRCLYPSSPLVPRCALAFAFLRWGPEIARERCPPLVSLFYSDRHFYSPAKVGAPSDASLILQFPRPNSVDTQGRLMKVLTVNHAVTHTSVVIVTLLLKLIANLLPNK